MDLENLINEVSKYPCLYEIKSPEYKNRFKKQIAWQQVALIMGIDEDTCAKKWRSIRDTYLQKKKEEITRSGQAAPKKGKAWHLMPYLSFLQPSFNARETVSTMQEIKSRPSNPTITLVPSLSQHGLVNNNRPVTYSSCTSPAASVSRPIETDSLIPNTVEEVEVDLFEFLDMPAGDCSMDHSYSSSSKTVSLPEENLKSKHVTPKLKSTKQKSKQQQLNSIEREEQAILKELDGLKNEDKKPDYTETELFLLSLAPGIDRLEPAKRAYTKIKLQTLVAEAEFGPNFNY